MVVVVVVVCALVEGQTMAWQTPQNLEGPAQPAHNQQPTGPEKDEGDVAFPVVDYSFCHEIGKDD